MMIEVSFWQLVSFALSLLGVAIGGAKWLWSQTEKGLDRRFDEQDAARKSGQSALDHRLASIEESQRATAGEWTRLERSLLELKAELPVNYVRREDYVRGQSVLEAKMDALYSKLEVLLTKGFPHA
jgi:hypothetical protein